MLTVTLQDRLVSARGGWSVAVRFVDVSGAPINLSSVSLALFADFYQANLGRTTSCVIAATDPANGLCVAIIPADVVASTILPYPSSNLISPSNLPPAQYPFRLHVYGVDSQDVVASEQLIAINPIDPRIGQFDNLPLPSPLIAIVGPAGVSGSSGLAAIQNGFFEDNFASWTLASSSQFATATIDPTRSDAGSKSALLSCTQTGKSISLTSAATPVGEGMQVYAAVRAMLVSGSPSVVLQAVFYNISKSEIGNANVGGTLALTSTWTEYGQGINTPPGTRYLALRVIASTTIGAVAIDELILSRFTPGTTTPGPLLSTVTASQITDATPPFRTRVLSTLAEERRPDLHFPVTTDALGWVYPSGAGYTAPGADAVIIGAFTDDEYRELAAKCAAWTEQVRATPRLMLQKPTGDVNHIVGEGQSHEKSAESAIPAVTLQPPEPTQVFMIGSSVRPTDPTIGIWTPGAGAYVLAPLHGTNDLSGAIVTQAQLDTWKASGFTPNAGYSTSNAGEAQLVGASTVYWKIHLAWKQQRASESTKKVVATVNAITDSLMVDIEKPTTEGGTGSGSNGNYDRTVDTARAVARTVGKVVSFTAGSPGYMSGSGLSPGERFRASTTGTLLTGVSAYTTYQVLTPNAGAGNLLFAALSGGPTATIAIGSSTTVTVTGASRAIGDSCVLGTDGNLPDGLYPGQEVFALDAGNTFRISATLGGPVIATSGWQSGNHTANFAANLSGTQSGTHYCNKVGSVILFAIHDEHGEADNLANTDGPTFQAHKSQMMDDLHNDMAVGIYGQTTPKEQRRAGVFCGVPGKRWATATFKIAKAYKALSLQNKEFVVTSPYYHLPTGTVAASGEHWLGNSYRWKSCKDAQVMHAVIDREEGWQPMLFIEDAGFLQFRADEILLGLHVPVAPAIFKMPYHENIAQDFADKGFLVKDGSTTPAITSVDIVEGRILRIKSTGTTFSAPQVLYADPSHSGLGSLCDSDDWVPPFGWDLTTYSRPLDNIPELVGKPYPMNNWCLPDIVTPVQA